MSKFRARQLDASKPIPVYMQEDIPDIAEYNAINRTVPQMPTGMEKEEETEHHLQQAIFHQRVIPVPEVYTIDKVDGSEHFDRMYPPSYKAPRQLIHIHPFSAEADIPEYDLDSEDEAWVNQHSAKGELPLTNLQFEEMMDRLEKASGLKAVTLQEAKVLLKDDDDLIIAVYDYWLNKRLRLAHALIPQVKTEKGTGTASSDPYVAFRKRTEKMQTRKNRKNDESSYEKMLKLKRDLTRAVTLLEMVKRREKMKREHLNLNIEVFERRYELQDFTGSILSEISSQRTQRPAFAPLFSNHQLSSASAGVSGASSGSWLKTSSSSHSSKVSKRHDSKRDRRSAYRKRRRAPGQISSSASSTPPTPQLTPTYTHPPDPYTIAAYPQNDPLGYPAQSSEEEPASPSPSENEEENMPDGIFTFKRKKFINYHAPSEGSWPWVPPSEGGGGDPRFRFSLTSLSNPRGHSCIGFARRRVGRGGRVWLDRLSSPLDDLLVKTDLRDLGPNGLTSSTSDFLHEIKTEWPHFSPSSPPNGLGVSGDADTDVEIDVETVGVPVTLSPDVNLNHSTTSHSEELSLGGLTQSITPSTLFIGAEILEGEGIGSITELEVSVPSEFDTLLHEDFENLESLEVNLLDSGTVGTGSSTCWSNSNINSNIGGTMPIPRGSGSSAPVGGVGSSLDSLSSSLSSSIGGAAAAGLSSLPASGSSAATCSFNSTSIEQEHSNSLNWSTQPSSKFFTLDSTSILPLAVSSLQLSTTVNNSSAASTTPQLQNNLATTATTTTTCTTLSTYSSSSSNNSSVNNSTITTTTTDSTSSPSPAITSLNNCVKSDVTSVLQSNNSESNSSSKGDNKDHSGVRLESCVITTASSSSSLLNDNNASLESSSSSSSALVQPGSGLVLSNNKNNGSNIVKSAATSVTTNNVLSSKLLASQSARTTNESTSRNSDNLTNSDSNNSSVLSNGPSQNNTLVDNSKCSKLDHYMFHET